MDKVTAEQKALIDDIAKDLTGIVEMIEGKPETTKDRYGDYMHFINDMAPDNNKKAFNILGLCFIQAGANKQGVASALRILGA